MEFQDSKINNVKKLTSLKDQFDQSMKTFEKNVAESITNKNKLNDLSERYLEMKSLAIKYKENKDLEIENLNKDINKFKKMIDESDTMYEAILDRTTKSLENIIKNADPKSDFVRNCSYIFDRIPTGVL